MKKAFFGTVLASGILVSATSAMADTGYVGIDYQKYRLVSEGGKDPQPEAAGFRIGGSLNDYFRVEGRVGTSVNEDSINKDTTDIHQYMGVYVKAGADLGDVVFPYVALGLSKADILTYTGTVSNNQFSFVKNRQTESDMSWGVGADAHFGDIQVGAEWMMMMDESNYELKVTTLSLGWRF